MQEITNADVLEFLRLLTNMGGTFHLDEEKMTITRNDGQECAVQEGDQVKPVQILFNGMVRDENFAVLNPFKMIEGNNPALTWFYQSRIAILGVLVKKIIVKIVELGHTKEIEDYDKLKLIAKISEQCDKTMVEELNKINASDYLRIFYNKKTKTAEAQTAVFTDALESMHKFRKKTWHVLAEVFRGLFDIGEEEGTMAKYSYRATILSIPEIDAKLHVMGQIINVIDPWCKSLLATDLNAEKFSAHLKNLETYARMYAWFTAKVSSDKLISTVSNHVPGTLPTQSPAWGTTPAMPVAQVPTMPTAADNSIKVDLNPCEISAAPIAQPSYPVFNASMNNTMAINAMPAPTCQLAGPAMMPATAPMGMPMSMPGMMPQPMYNGPIGMVPQVMPSVGPSTADENRISINC